jgi:hypothetical protein
MRVFWDDLDPWVKGAILGALLYIIPAGISYWLWQRPDLFGEMDEQDPWFLYQIMLQWALVTLYRWPGLLVGFIGVDISNGAMVFASLIAFVTLGTFSFGKFETRKVPALVIGYITVMLPYIPLVIFGTLLGMALGYNGPG